MQDVKLTLASARIVRIMLEDPARPSYQSELMARTGMGSGAVVPILRRLAAAGWITSRREDIDPVTEGRPRRTLYSFTEEAVPLAQAKIHGLAAEIAPEGKLMSSTEVSTEEAIAELDTPTGDSETDEMQQGMAETLRKGWITVVGRSEDGALQFRMTDAGKRFVEGMGKR